MNNTQIIFPSVGYPRPQRYRISKIEVCLFHPRPPPKLVSRMANTEGKVLALMSNEPGMHNRADGVNTRYCCPACPKKDWKLHRYIRNAFNLLELRLISGPDRP
jgi:hypothetical protein